MARHATQDEQIREHVDRLQLTGDPNRQAFVRELVDDVEDPDLAHVMRACLDGVIRLHVIAVLWAKPDAGAVVVPDPPSLGLRGRDLQTRAKAA